MDNLSQNFMRIWIICKSMLHFGICDAEVWHIFSVINHQKPSEIKQKTDSICLSLWIWICFRSRALSLSLGHSLLKSATFSLLSDIMLTTLYNLMVSEMWKEAYMIWILNGSRTLRILTLLHRKCIWELFTVYILGQ